LATGVRLCHFGFEHLEQFLQLCDGAIHQRASELSWRLRLCPNADWIDSQIGKVVPTVVV